MFFLWWELVRFTHNNSRICNTVLLMIATMLYVTSPWGNKYLFYNWKFGLFESLCQFFPHPISTSLLHFLQPPICSVFFFLLNSTYKWDSTVFVFLSLSYSLSIMPSRSICVVPMARFHSFLWLSDTPQCVSVCVCIKRFLHSLLMDIYIVSISWLL